MKNFVALTVFSCCLILALPVVSQVSKELSPGYYVVVGAYAKGRENIARDYTEVLTRKGYKADYGFNASRNLYFVYLGYFTDLKSSLVNMSETRKITGFKDAWVRVVPGKIVPQEQAQPSTATSPTPAQDQPATTPEKETQPASDFPVPPPSDTDSIVVTDNPEIVQYPRMTLGNTEVFLSLYNGRNNRIVEGEVSVIDTERSKLLTKVKGNEYLILPDPKSKSGQLTLVCEAFGYRKTQEEINYPLPLADTVKPHIELMGTTIVVNFDMVRYHKGDIAVLYNVYFYNDAAVMAPQSQFELNSLLQMMQERPGYRIKLHGHTNGNYNGKIIKMGPDKNFFSLDGSVSTIGSAKDLSYNRAEVIKEYLVANGIAADRIEIKAWGGKRPLYDKRSVNAKKNVRVEVEILQE